MDYGKYPIEWGCFGLPITILHQALNSFILGAKFQFVENMKTTNIEKLVFLNCNVSRPNENLKLVNLSIKNSPLKN